MEEFKHAKEQKYKLYVCMTKFILKRTEQQEIAEYAVLKDDF